MSEPTASATPDNTEQPEPEQPAEPEQPVYRITHARHASGTLWGVQFTDGTGYCSDPQTLERLRRQGHRVDPVPTATPSG